MDVAFVVVGGQWKGRVIEVDSRKFLIGRGEHCHFQPESMLIGRMHCLITVDGENVTIEDCGEAIGTRLSGERIRLRWKLKHGDQIAIANLELEVRLGNNHAEESDNWLADVIQDAPLAEAMPTQEMSAVTDEDANIRGRLTKNTDQPHKSQQGLPRFTGGLSTGALKKWLLHAKELAWENTDKLLIVAIVMLIGFIGLSMYEPTSAMMSKAGEALWKGALAIVNVPKWRWWGWSLLCLATLVVSVLAKAWREA